MSDATNDLLVERDGAIATLVINRPDSHNALRLEMFQALPALVGELCGDEAIKVIVVRGAGRRAFASGADITEFRELRADAKGARIYNAAVSEAERALVGAPKPVIAMVHGYCMGGGAGIALACDLRFADDRAQFGVPPAKLGLVYGFEATKRLVDVVGPARAKWLLMSGQPVGAGQALALGLFDEVTAPDDLGRLTYEFAELVCSRAQFTVRAAKQIVGRILAGQTEDDDVTRELRNSSYDTVDYAEGVSAFLEKRPPTFTWQ